MLRTSAYSWPVINAEQLRDARIRAGYTSQKALADALGVSERTVTSWEADGGRVSGRAEARVRALLWPAPAPLAHYSDFELLSEIGRRLEAARGGGSVITREPEPDDPVIEDVRVTYGTGRRGPVTPSTPAFTVSAPGAADGRSATPAPLSAARRAASRMRGDRAR